MDYNNKKKVSDLVSSIEWQEERLKLIENTEEHWNHHRVYILIESTGDGKEELKYETSNEIKELLLSKKKQEIQDDIDRMKKELEQL